MPWKKQALQSTHHLFWNLFRESPRGSITWKRRHKANILYITAFLKVTIFTLLASPVKVTVPSSRKNRNSLNTQKNSSSSYPTMANSFVVHLHFIICLEIRNISMLKNAQICLEFRQQTLLMFNNLLKPLFLLQIFFCKMSFFKISKNQVQTQKISLVHTTEYYYTKMQKLKQNKQKLWEFQVYCTH